MGENLKLVGELSENLIGDNKVVSYEIIHQLFEYILPFRSEKNKKNFLDKFLSATIVDYNKSYLLDSDFSDDYVFPKDLIIENLNLFFDDSTKVFEIIIPKDFIMTDKETSVPNLEYKGTDILRRFKKFIHKVIPNLTLYLISTDDVVNHTFLDDITSKLIRTNISFVNNLDFTYAIYNEDFTDESIKKIVFDCYKDICKCLNTDLKYSKVVCYRYANYHGNDYNALEVEFD